MVLYEKALKKFEQKTSKEYKAGIAELESLGNWKDAAKIVEERKKELEEIEKEEKKKKKKIKMIIIIAVAAVAAIIIGVSVIKSVTTPNLADYGVTKDATINSMSYKIPEECTLEDNSSDTFAQYSLSRNDNVIGVIEVEYRGDSDLSGDAGFDAETAEHKSTDSALALIPDASGTYQDAVVRHGGVKQPMQGNPAPAMADYPILRNRKSPA